MLIENQYLWFCMNGSLFHSLGPAKTEMLYLLYISQIQVPGESSTLLLFCCWTIQTSLLNSPRVFFSTMTYNKNPVSFALNSSMIESNKQSKAGVGENTRRRGTQFICISRHLRCLLVLSKSNEARNNGNKI